MRLNNKNRVPICQFFITLATLFLVIGLLLNLLNFINLPVLERRLGCGLILLSIIIYTIIYLQGRQIFEYDSDGETLNFKNRSIIPMMRKPASDEFPKYKLVNFEIVNAIIFKRLYIKIISKKHKESILKYDISYLTSKEIRDLRLSLGKTIRQNKERQD